MCIMTRLNTLLLLVVTLLSSGEAFLLRPAAATGGSTSANSILRFRQGGSTVTTSGGGGWGMGTSTSSSVSASSSALSVIKSEEMDFERDIGRGGVRLAQESAVKMKGQIKYQAGGGKVSSAAAAAAATPVMQELIRYTTVTPLTEQTVKDQLQSMGATIVCTGQGKEVYADPGTTAEVRVVLAPADAVRAALTGVSGAAVEAAAAVAACDKLVINVAGGDDLQVKEVLDALEELVVNLEVPSSANIQFNSLSHAGFPMLTTTITVVAMTTAEASSGDTTGAEQSVAEGEVYLFEGKWYTVVPEDINTAVA